MMAKCFYLEEKIKTYNDAKTNCAKKPGRLFEPKSYESSVMVAKYVRDVSSRNFFRIGVHDIDQQYNYVYESNSMEINFTPIWHKFFDEYITDANNKCILVATDDGID